MHGGVKWMFVIREQAAEICAAFSKASARERSPTEQ